MERGTGNEVLDGIVVGAGPAGLAAACAAKEAGAANVLVIERDDAPGGIL
ncbi:MAG: NAD(P)-binding domain-containing protein, partial [Kiritimatiellae bacterium]|nr:NAD(P)-binding domain-containing protein [Kiritimatiellia bacterium]